MTSPSKHPDASGSSLPRLDPGWAWAPYRPDDERPWTLARVGHLHRRAAFGASRARLQRDLERGPEAALDELLAPACDLAAFDRGYDAYEAAAASSRDEQRAWWLRRMIETPHPLREKMTLFWHGWFAVSGAGITKPAAMQHHLQLLREHALGNLEALLLALGRDAAFLEGLGGESNRKSRPALRFARILLGEFTVGPETLDEEDVTEAARAFTGRFVIDGRFREMAREHDGGSKRVLGQTGAFDGDDVLHIAAHHPATAHRLAAALWRFLISETEAPSAALLEPLASRLARDGDVATMVETMLRSNLFFSPRAYRRRIKSPVEFAVGIIRPLEGMVSTTRLGRDLAELGQSLLAPPTPSGWAGGEAWIDRMTLLRRHALGRALVREEGPYGGKLDPAEIAASHARPDEGAEFLLELFLQSDLDAPRTKAFLAGVKGARPGGGRRVAGALFELPEFQLA